MAALASSSFSLLFSPPSLSSSPHPPRLSLPHSSPSLSFSFSISSSSPSFLVKPHSTPHSASSSLTVSAAAAAEKKKVLIVNTNSGAHAVIGFYFAKELLASGHAVTVLTIGEEGSDKMKKPPFTRFSVRFNFHKLRHFAVNA